MSDEKSDAGRSSFPDHIPGHILDDLEESARHQVAAERIYVETVRSSGVTWRHVATRAASGLRGLWLLLLWLVAGTATAIWLGFERAPTGLFPVASLSVVAAVLGTAKHLWDRRPSGFPGS